MSVIAPTVDQSSGATEVGITDDRHHRHEYSRRALNDNHHGCQPSGTAISGTARRGLRLDPGMLASYDEDGYLQWR
jgi:hypothetical protein